VEDKIIMDKQISNIKLLDNGDIRLKTRRTVTPYNEVLSLNTDCVRINISDKYVVTMDTEDYFNLVLWANRLEMGHADIRKGVVAVDTGYTHKSVPALIMQTKRGQRVSYRDGNRFNLRKSNLYIIGEPDDTCIED
jgi:hypothetical protein